MKKKIYMMPLFEVAKVNMSGAVLTGSPTDDWSMDNNPAHPGQAPKHDTPAF